jgi:hypothetical protein
LKIILSVIVIFITSTGIKSQWTRVENNNSIPLNSQTGYLTNHYDEIYMTRSGGEPTKIVDTINYYRNVKIYPKSVGDEINIESNLNIIDDKVIIYNSNVQVVNIFRLMNGKTRIPFQTSEKGLYLIRIEIKNSTLMKKIIKE